MLNFFKRFLPSFKSGRVPDTHVELTYAQIRDIAAPGPVPEAARIDAIIPSKITVKGQAYHAWMAVASAIVETRCHATEQNDLNDTRTAVQEIASLIKDSPSRESVTFERKHLSRLFRKTIFLKEIAKHQAEKGSKGEAPYVTTNNDAPNVIPFFEGNSKRGLRVAGRRNARMLTGFAENIDALAGLREPAADAPEQSGFGIQLRWGP